MFGFLVTLHLIVCVLLAIVILMQAGRGGGLTEGFASAESFLGAKTTGFMVKTTAVLTSLFLILSLSLAYISSKTSRSLITAERISGKKVDAVSPLTANALSEPAAAQQVPAEPVSHDAVKPEESAADNKPKDSAAAEKPVSPDSAEKSVEKNN